ncbi:MAG TPA: L,D-transpeptidase [Gammaproteobacteria bacterium]|nr:L,D-transpeptidase [Gammaproteobacteria bacterium]
MNWQDLNREVAEQLSGNPALGDERPIIYIDCRQQMLYRFDIETENNRSYPISTAARGMGNRCETFKTPFGTHRIRQKIGGGEARGMIFEAREPTGKIASSLDNRDKDEITSRILWLDGLQEGINKGGVHDTFSRYIYIHGTSDEKRIGEPVSAGCIRMKNDDVIELFDEVLVDDIVVIR